MLYINNGICGTIGEYDDGGRAGYRNRPMEVAGAPPGTLRGGHGTSPAAVFPAQARLSFPA